MVGVGLSVVAFVSAGWHHLVLEDAGQRRYARLAGDVHPTYLSLHATVAWLGCGRQWGQNRWLSWAMTVLVAVSLGLMGSKAGILAAGIVAVTAWALSRFRSRARRGELAQVGVFLGLLLAVSWGIQEAVRGVGDGGGSGAV